MPWLPKSRAPSGQMRAATWNSAAPTYTLLQSSLHVEERVGNAADPPHDPGACLLMVLEHPVSVEGQEVAGHAADIYRLQTQIRACPRGPLFLALQRKRARSQRTKRSFLEFRVFFHTSHSQGTYSQEIYYRRVGLGIPSQTRILTTASPAQYQEVFKSLQEPGASFMRQFASHKPRLSALSSNILGSWIPGIIPGMTNIFILAIEP